MDNQLDDIAQLQAEARRAEQARSVLQSPAFIDAFEALRKDLMSQMSAVSATDDKTKCKLIDMWKLLDGLENWFRKAIESGDYAALQLEERRKFSLLKRA